MSVTNIQIKALNAETGEFKEKLLKLTTGIKRDCLLGRHSSCDLVLDSAEVSRIHGRIWCQDGQCFYTDLGSTDGSQINDQKVGVNQVYPLKQNHLLRIGGFIVTIDHQSIAEQSAVTVGQPHRWSGGELTVRCLQAIAETPDVKTFRFVAEPTVLFSYKPGQFVTLDLDIEGKRALRSYSISSTPSRPHTLEITVKRVPPPTEIADAPPGLVSNWLHDRLTVGSQVKLKGPMGKFTCVDNPAQKLLFISAGSGITPMMSMSRWLCDTGANVDIIFIHSTRSPRDFIFRHELESMAARYSNFQLAVTATCLEPGQAWVGYTGRLNELMLQAIAPDLQERTVYVCGANPFMEEVKTRLEELLFPMENYHEESFGSPPRKQSVKKKQEDRATINTYIGGDSSPQSSSNQELHPDITKEKPENIISVNTTQERSSIVFDKLGKEIAGDREDTILEIAEQEGIELPSGCRMGACGACKLPLLAGEVNYDDDPDCEPGHLLTCIAKPVGRVVIEA
ncbi:Flavodoxin reductase family 1 protein [Hyella patelloides LEGE 07179]|uniref:Ferredoxin--NADP reductase n=1 Tax=Hyella patelloides LEGE 07179 TaxID=945734 RepID=A0A563VZH5_9CYAN|nr:FHA domain-containing protein [Hyella patelloides]VEP16820.1 Flavodoxin reductase family 1 protein [Hyella patelloides LEGE 07179]